MTNLRPMETLLEILLEEFRYPSYGNKYKGLCAVVSRIKDYNKISAQEKYKLEDHITEYSKTRTEWYYINSSFILRKNGPLYRVSQVRDGGEYIWIPYAKKPRIKWLKEQINNFKQSKNEPKSN